MARKLSENTKKYFAKYVTKYTKENIRIITFKLNKSTQTKLIDWIESKPNKNEYLTNLVRDDMEKK